MKISYFAKQMALQSEPVWKSFLLSCQKYGMTPVENSMDADCLLIWSVLWRGRMAANKHIYEHYRNLNKPVFICEVGSLIRGKTWKVALNNITKDGIYANDGNFIQDRDKKLGIQLEKISNFESKPILIAGQHDQSLQWTENVSMVEWIRQIIKKIRQYTTTTIHIRPHPRNLFEGNFGSNTLVESPIKISGSYDQYDLKSTYKTVINYNSGIGIWGGLNGIPIICHSSSLASDIAMNFNDLNQPYISDRNEWFKKILHTEWLVEEIEAGIPIQRLIEQSSLTC